MSSERSLLAAACGSRRAHGLIAEDTASLGLSAQSTLFLEHVGAYYARDQKAQQVDLELLLELLKAGLPNPKHHASFERLVEMVKGDTASPENVAELLAGQRRVALGGKLANAILTDDTASVGVLMESYNALLEGCGADEDLGIFNAPTLGEVGLNKERGNLIKMLPNSLNKRLDGGMMRGHHCVVFARPEMGKTTFVVNLTYGFLRQGLRVLYLSNEEPVSDTVLRVQCRLTGKQKYEVANNEEALRPALAAMGYDNFFIRDMHPGTLGEIENYVRRVEPDVLIVDQMRNVSAKEDSMVRQLEKVATGLRNIGGRYKCLVISVTQAGDSATGKAGLEMGDVDSSNTGVPGACDVMIGFGGTESDIAASVRMISLPKNKRSGDHGMFPVRVDLTTYKVSSMGGE